MLNADGSLPVDGSGDFELVSKRGPPRGPRGPRREGVLGAKMPPSPPMSIATTAAAAAAAAMMLPQGRPPPSPNAGGGHSPLNSAMLGPASFWAMMGQHQHQQAAALAISQHNPNGLQMVPPPLIPISGITPLDIRLPHSMDNQVNHSGIPQHQMAPSQRASPGRSGASPLKPAGASPMQFHCNFCGFPADTQSTLTQHMLKVHAVENQDLFNMFGIHAESLADEATGAPPVAKSVSYKHENSPPNVSEAWANMMQSVSGNGGELAVTSAVPTLATCHGMVLPPPDGGIYAMSTTLASDVARAGLMTGVDSVPRVYNQTPSKPRRPRPECPLDLTKQRRSDGEEDDDMMLPRSSPGVKRKSDADGSNENSNMSVTDAVADLAMPTPPRKRSRKGKAYKLDTLSLKMQEQYEDSPPDGDLEDDEASNQSAPNYMASTYRSTSVITDGKNSSQPTFPMLHPDDATFGSYHHEASPRRHIVDFLEGGLNMREMNRMAGGRMDHDDGLMRPRSKSIGDIGRFSRGAAHMQPPNCVVDPSSAYSLGMSRRKLFMIQQMEHQISHEQSDPTTSLAAPAMPTLAAAMAAPTVVPVPATPPAPVATSTPIVVPPEEKKSKPTPTPPASSSSGSAKKDGSASQHTYECAHCEIMFRNCVMYTMHMGYHGYHNPLKCKMCGYESKDQLDFFLHIARVAHE